LRRRCWTFAIQSARRQRKTPFVCVSPRMGYMPGYPEAHVVRLRGPWGFRLRPVSFVVEALVCEIHWELLDGDVQQLVTLAPSQLSACPVA
jgi:hypothetical protein